MDRADTGGTESGSLYSLQGPTFLFTSHLPVSGLYISPITLSAFVYRIDLC